MLRIIYRLCGGNNGKVRPEWYSKQRCLTSMSLARERLATSDLLLLVDGDVPEVSMGAVPDSRITIAQRSGNSESFLEALAIAAAWPEDDVVYFVEDDYLHVPESLVKLEEAFEDTACDYVTLYDHPDRYRSPSSPDADLPLRENGVHVSRSHHWRTVESTCMTFAARSRCIVEDLGIFLTHVLPCQMPYDRSLFRHLQGLGQYETSGHGRRLLGAIPSLATHCERAFLAPCVDWAAVAASSVPTSDAKNHGGGQAANRLGC